MLATASLTAAMLLAGCGGDAKPDPTNTTTAAPTSTSASTSPAPSPTTDPNIPAAARAHTPAGAEAFVRYFYSQLNLAWTTPATGLLSALSAPTCKTCSALEGTAADLVSKKQHYRGDAYSVKSVGSIGESEVLVVGEQPIGAVIASNGSVVKSKSKAEPAKFIATVVWSAKGWRINEIKVLK